MCGHLMKAGFSASVYNRTRSKAQSLLDAGAAGPIRPGNSPRRRTSCSASSVFRATCAISVVLGADGAAGRESARHHSGRHDHERTLAGRGNRGRSPNTRSAQRRCAGVGRRRRRPRGSIVDHDRRRKGGRRRAGALLASYGQNHRASRRTRRGSAHKDGQSES